jgi:hypothetical protein
MDRKFSKAERAKLRDLAGEAHARELSTASTDLFERFKSWTGDQISVFDLNQDIHEFHNGVSRKLYVRYVMGDPTLAVTGAVATGVLSPEDVGEGLMAKLDEAVQAFSTVL